MSDDWCRMPDDRCRMSDVDSWITQNEHLLLKAPSVVVEGEFNILINPANQDYHKIKIANIEDFNFDGRLFKKYGE